jgi:hypothetical protein
MLEIMTFVGALGVASEKLFSGHLLAPQKETEMQQKPYLPLLFAETLPTPSDRSDAGLRPSMRRDYQIT